MNVGSFWAMIDFVIVAFVIFMIVKAVNKMKRKEAGSLSAPPALQKIRCYSQKSVTCWKIIFFITFRKSIK